MNDEARSARQTVAPQRPAGGRSPGRMTAVSGASSGGPSLPSRVEGEHSAGLVGGGGLQSALPSWAKAFPGTPRQVSAARRFVSGLLEGSPFCDDGVMVLSELFTNAVVHTASGKPGGLVIVQVGRWRYGVRIAVTDQGSSSQPIIRDPAEGAEAAENGHGLYLAACLADHLSWHDDPSGRTIAAVLGRLSPGHHPESGRSGPGATPHPYTSKGDPSCLLGM
jgi:serine/threonine-protein kinase RsbW